MVKHRYLSWRYLGPGVLLEVPWSWDLIGGTYAKHTYVSVLEVPLFRYLIGGTFVLHKYLSWRYLGIAKVSDLKVPWYSKSYLSWTYLGIAKVSELEVPWCRDLIGSTYVHHRYLS